MCYFSIDRTADQEIVLEIFLSTNYNIDQALEKLRLPTTDKNYCINNQSIKKKARMFSRIFVDSSAPWTLTECDQFEQCFKEYGKDFFLFKVRFSHLKSSLLSMIYLDS